MGNLRRSRIFKACASSHEFFCLEGLIKCSVGCVRANSTRTPRGMVDALNSLFSIPFPLHFMVLKSRFLRVVHQDTVIGLVWFILVWSGRGGVSDYGLRHTGNGQKSKGIPQSHTK